MDTNIHAFIDKYVKEIKEDNAALFLGAGFSKSAGYVDWKSLLRKMSDELGLDVEREHDLVGLAQYYYNQNGNRCVINDTILEEFSKEGALDENHQLIARLPIFTYWTTNYDSLIEDALKAENRTVDVKCNNRQLSLTRPHRDAIVYKMHGDKNDPGQAVLIKDDYEKYYRDHAQFITTLSGDLISKTFLFIGFSFMDPNIDYILSRVRVDYEKENSRQHYTIMKRIAKSAYSSDEDYEYDCRKQNLFIEDLKRYNIKALLIDEYSQITDILKEIQRKLSQHNIFISGSAETYDPQNPDDALKFIQNLSTSLIQKQYNIISGFGLGVGSAVIIGALQEIYMNQQRINDNRLLLRPFPQGIIDEENRQRLWRQYREDMISRAGVSIFIYGNKLNDGNIVIANGVRAEYEIAHAQHNVIVPVGCTGFAAQKIWQEVHNNMSDFYTNVDAKLKEAFEKLNEWTDCEDLINNIISFIELFQNGNHQAI